MTLSAATQNQANESTREVFVFPCSFAQRRLWFLHQLDPSSPVYNISAPMRVSGVLDIVALQRSLNEVVRRHESLRTTFSSVQGEPMQIVACSQALELKIVDFTTEADDKREFEIRQLIAAEVQRPFDLERGPLLRVILVRCAAEDQVLLLTMHHIISDGWSMGVLMHEVSVLYDSFHRGAPSPLAELPLQYADFSEWQRKWLAGEVLEKQLDYWKGQLAGMPPALELPTDWPRSMNQGTRGGRQTVSIGTNLAQRLRHMARNQSATLYMVLLAAFQSLLSRYSGQEDISVGSPIAGRSRAQTEGLIGFFVNTLVLRTDLSGVPSFTELVNRVKQMALAAFSHQDVPFEKLVEVLAPARDLSRTPLFQVMFILQNTPPVQLRLGPCTLSLLDVSSEVTKFELTLSLEESGEGISGYVDYRADLLESNTISRFLQHYQRLLTAVIENPGQPIATLPLLDEPERRQLLIEWNGEQRSGFAQRCVHELFEDYAMRMPDALAVADERGRLTYQELNRRANQLARHLQGLGVAPEISVGIFIEPSVEMMVGVLGILKAGGGYLPLDPVFPKDRISYILSDSQVSVLLTRSDMQERISAPENHVVCLDAIDEVLAAYDSGNLPNTATMENRVYTIYTSGSTGRPKGVVVEHRQIVNYLHSILERFDLRPGAQYGMLQPLAVDSSNTVLFPCMCGGGTLHGMPRDRASDPYAVQQYFRQYRIDVLKIAPSHLAALLEACPSSVLLPVGVLALGGEGSHWDWMKTRVQPLAPSGSKVFIHYGPTETTVGMLTNPVRPDAPRRGTLVPLGRPLPNTKVFVLDGTMQPAPIGIPGEIYIGGDCVARGYLNRPELTAEKFVPDPFSTRPGARLYRTGDLGRWLPEGEIEFLGRTDYQVKIRGFRIELGEVESVLRQHQQIERAVAIAREDPAAGKQLVAYVTLKQAPGDAHAANGNNQIGTSLSARLRDFVRERLPDYMVPAAVVVLDRMPLSPQGKVDLKGLPAPSFENNVREKATVRPRTLLEAQLVEVWEEVLNTRPVGVTDDFFQLGGHSLLAVRMIALMRNRFQRTIALQSLFRNPTIAHLANFQETQNQASSGILVELQGQGAGRPLFCVHPVGGSALCYMELARALGQDQRFFALQSPSEKCSQAVGTIEEMASLYRQEIQRVQPHGPYLLAGWSMGGLVALELARQLQQDGESIGFVVLFDTYPPSQNRENADAGDELPLLARFAADIGRVMNIDVSAARDKFLELDDVERLKLLLDVLKQHGVLAQDSPESELTSMLDIFQRNMMAADQYRLQPMHQHVVLFYATEAGQPGYLAGAWPKWIVHRLDCHAVPASHYGIMRQPHVAGIAEQLQQYFTQVETDTKTSIAEGGE